MSNAHWLRDTSFVVLRAQAIMVLSLNLKGTIKVLLEKAGLGCIGWEQRRGKYRIETQR